MAVSMSAARSALTVPYGKSGAMAGSKPGLPGSAFYPMDNSYPQTSLASASGSAFYPKSNSRHGLATFSSRAEQQSIFKLPPGQANNNQK